MPRTQISKEKHAVSFANLAMNLTGPAVLKSNSSVRATPKHHWQLFQQNVSFIEPNIAQFGPHHLSAPPAAETSGNASVQKRSDLT
jgi:hypothetical protein